MATKTKKKQKKRGKWPNHSHSLSPFYSFENHWLHVSRKVLCLTSWGTCMGGINEQFDDMLDYEASGDWVHETHEKAMKKWKEERQKYGKYQPMNTNKTTKRSKQTTYHSYQTKQSKANYTMQHKLLEYKYPNQSIQKVNKQNEANETETKWNNNLSDEIIKNAQINRRRAAVHSIEEPKNEKEKETKNEIEIEGTIKNAQINQPPGSESLPQRRRAGHSFEETKETNNEKEDIENKELSDEETSPLMLPMDPMQRRESQHIIGAQSMDRKLSEFNAKIEMKRRSTMKDLEWQKKHHPNKNFKPMDDDGMDEIDSYSAYPVGRGVVKKRPRAVSKIEKSAYMKSKGDANAIEYNDKLATMDTKSKIRLMNQLSVERKNNE